MSNQITLFPEPEKLFFCGICHRTHAVGKCSLNNLDIVPYLPENYFVSVRNFKLSVNDLTGTVQNHRPTTHNRSTVTFFSSKSGRRMKDFLSTLDYSKFQYKMFFTCTYRDIYPLDKDSLHRHLLMLIKRIERLIPDVCLIWRIELQKRSAPHFHFLIFSPHKLSISKKISFGTKLKKDWGTITADINKYSFTRGSDLVELYSLNKVVSYIAKYTSKQQEEKTLVNYGRLWGFRGTIVEQTTDTFYVSKEFLDLLRSYIKTFYNRIPGISDDFMFYISYYKDFYVFLSPKTIERIFKSCQEKLKQKPILVPDLNLSAL